MSEPLETPASSLLAFMKPMYFHQCNANRANGIFDRLKNGDLYDLCLEIFRTQAASGQRLLDDNMLGHMNLPTLYDDNMAFIAAVALSKPTLDYDELFGYACKVDVSKEILDSMALLIDRFGYRESFYFYLMATQEGNDGALLKAFQIDNKEGARLVAIHGNKAAFDRVYRGRKGHQAGVSETLATFSPEKAKGLRMALSGREGMSNYEFVQRFNLVIDPGKPRSSQEAAIPIHFDSFEAFKSLPEYEAKIDSNREEVIKRFFTVMRYLEAEDVWKMEAEAGFDIEQLLQIETELVIPAIKVANDRFAMFFSQCLGLENSIILDFCESDDGGKQRYLTSLYNSVETDDVKAERLARPFILSESPEFLLSGKPSDKALARLYEITGSKAFLEAGNGIVRDRAMATDLGL